MKLLVTLAAGIAVIPAPGQTRHEMVSLHNPADQARHHASKRARAKLPTPPPMMEANTR